MSLFSREKLQVLASPKGVLMMILIVAAAGSFIFLGGGSKSSGETYFYDLEAGRVFTADLVDGLPPILSPYSGKETGAYIFIFSGSSCGNYDGKTLEEIETAGGVPGYLVVYSDQARMMAKQTGQIRDFQAGRMVKRPADTKWLPSSGYESKFASEARSRCGEGAANSCQP